MRLKKMFRIFTIFMVLVCGNTCADDSELIKQLHYKYKDVSHYTAQFIQEKKTNYISKLLITQGRLEFGLNQGLIWEVEKPLWVKTLITDQGVFKSTKYENRKKVKDIQIKLIAEIMTELITANLNKIESHFNVSSVKQDNQEKWQINLNPKKLIMKKALKRISLLGEKGLDGNGEIKGISQIVIVDKSENITRIKLKNIQLYKGHLSDEMRSQFE